MNDRADTQKTLFPRQKTNHCTSDVTKLVKILTLKICQMQMRIEAFILST